MPRLFAGVGSPHETSRETPQLCKCRCNAGSVVRDEWVGAGGETLPDQLDQTINPKVLRALRGNVGPAGAKGATGTAGVAGSPGSPGKEGPQGREGPQGKEGPSKLSAIKEVLGPEVFVPAEKAGESVALCPKGSRAISGGSFIEATFTAPNVDNNRATKGRTGWVVEIGNPSKTESIFVQAVAYCAGENEAVAG